MVGTPETTNQFTKLTATNSRRVGRVKRVPPASVFLSVSLMVGLVSLGPPYGYNSVQGLAGTNIMLFRPMTFQVSASV